MKKKQEQRLRELEFEYVLFCPDGDETTGALWKIDYINGEAKYISEGPEEWGVEDIYTRYDGYVPEYFEKLGLEDVEEGDFDTMTFKPICDDED